MQQTLLPTHTGTLRLQAEASIASYMVLSGPWMVVGSGYIYIAILRNRLDLLWIAGPVYLICILWIIWLRGFAIIVDNNVIKYRDGFYKITTIPIDSISDYRNVWITYSIFGLNFPINRLRLTFGDRNKCLLINTKPFSRKHLSAFMKCLRSLSFAKTSS